MLGLYQLSYRLISNLFIILTKWRTTYNEHIDQLAEDCSILTRGLKFESWIYNCVKTRKEELYRLSGPTRLELNYL